MNPVETNSCVISVLQLTSVIHLLALEMIGFIGNYPLRKGKVFVGMEREKFLNVLRLKRGFLLLLELLRKLEGVCIVRWFMLNRNEGLLGRGGRLCLYWPLPLPEVLYYQYKQAS